MGVHRTLGSAWYFGAANQKRKKYNGRNKVKYNGKMGGLINMRRALKKIVSLALAATLVAGTALPTFAAAEENCITESTWYQSIVRKVLDVEPVEGYTRDYNTESPYLNVNVGMFHNVPVDAGNGCTGIATYYLPDGMSPWAPGVIIMTPDHTTAEEFSQSVTGLQWCKVADENKIGIAFVEPENGGEWNLTLSKEGRDDAALLDALYQLMRKKGVKLTGAWSMDKSHTALVGYEEGGAAALLFGGRWASDFSSIVAVDAAEVPAASLKTLGEGYVLPFPGDSTRGIEEEAIAAKTVDTPVWFIRSDVKGDNAAAFAYYLNANTAVAAEANELAQQVYTTGREGSASEVWVSSKKQSPETIWNEFSGQFKRFMAMQLPGRVAKSEDFTRTGFTIHEEEVNGEIRRWMTYVPSTYTGDTETPLVLVCHGYTASMYAIAEESRWYDVAEENGFIVVFAQGQVRPAGLMGNIPTAMWLGGAFSALAGKDTDPAVDVNFLNTLLDRMEADFNIDTGRVYMTGHSNGSIMTWAMAAEATERFAAIAPVGYMNDLDDKAAEDLLLPIWAFLGEYDSAGDPSMIEGNATVKGLQRANQYNKTNEEWVEESTSYDGAFVTKTFSNDAGIPLVKFTNVLDTPHVYLQEESVSIWNEFFSKYSRGEDGTLYYQAEASAEPVAVTAGEYTASADWYTAQ